MIRLPIVIDDEGDLSLAESVDEAERYMEPIDVKNGQYVVYAADGSLLEARVEESGPRERTRLVPVPTGAMRERELRTKLIDCLIRISELRGTLDESSSLQHESLGQLINRLREDARRRWIPDPR